VGDQALNRLMSRRRSVTDAPSWQFLAGRTREEVNGAHSWSRGPKP
jgi:hypothetical protein